MNSGEWEEPSKLNEPTMVLDVLATVRAAGNPVPNPGAATSHVTAVVAIHECVAHTDGCIRTDTVQSTVTKLRPATVMVVEPVTAALGRSKPLIAGAARWRLM